MRALVACDWFLKYASEQVAALAATGVDTALLCRTHAYEFDGSQDERAEALDRVRSAGARVFELDGRVSSAPSAPRVLRELADVRRWRPDVVHAHDNHDPRLLAATRGFPLALTIHDPTPHPGARRLSAPKRAIRALWVKRARRLVVHGPALRDELAASVDPARIAVIPHGAAPSTRPLPQPEEPRILFFGRLQPYKGLEVLLEAMRTVWDSRPDVRLLVLGEGPEAARLPADERIERSIGYVPEAEVELALQRASLLVLPYVQGSQSGVGLLALARGIPAVVTDVGSLPELALDRSFVVPPRDASQLAAALLRHLDHDASVRRAALAHAEREFSWRVVAERSAELYRILIEESRR